MRNERVSIFIVAVIMLVLLWAVPLFFTPDIYIGERPGSVQGTFSGQTITQYYPYAEWTLSGIQYTGNPYDVEASVIFTRQGGGEIREVDMFFAGDDGDNTGIWKFRFNGDLTGVWDFVTESSDPQDVTGELDNWDGQVTVNANINNILGRGFLQADSTNPNKWTTTGWESTNRALSPRFVMAAGPDIYYFTPGKLTNDVELFLFNHNQTAESQTNYGFDGFYIPVYCRWFDINAQDGRCSNVTSNTYNDGNTRNPDLRTFNSLENIIRKTYERGGITHIDLWGKDNSQNSNQGSYGGPSGTAATRLYRYIAARLGALPGWTMSFGDDEINVFVEDWYDTFNGDAGIPVDGKIDWPHLLTAPGKVNDNDSSQIDGNLNNNDTRLIAFNFSDYGLLADDTNTYSWGVEQPSYNHYLDMIGVTPVNAEQRPHFAEQKFVAGNTNNNNYDFESDSYTYLMQQRNMMYAMMVGGVAGIYGNIGDPGEVDIYDGELTSLEFDVDNYFSGTVPNDVDVNRQHPDGATATPYDAQQPFLNVAILTKKFLKADMVTCTDKVINDSEDGSTGFSLNDGSGVCLESPSSGDELIIIYEEDLDPVGSNSQIEMDLSSYPAVNDVRAIDLRSASYSEVVVAGLSNSDTETWTPPSASDWVLIINNDDGVSPPNQITDLSATQADQQIILNWTEPDDNGDLISNYIVNFRVQGNPTWGADNSTNSTSNTYTVSGTLVAGTTYEFRVRAVNSEGTASAPGSNIATATVIGVPSAVADLAGVQDGSAVDLSWTAPNNNSGTITDYIVEYKLSTDSEYTIFDEGVGAGLAATVPDLTGGDTFDFRIAAVNAAGQGPYSNVAQVSMTSFLPPIVDQFRFYNFGNGTHFYTMSVSERNKIQNNLAHIYSYDGALGKVFQNNDVASPEVIPVYRFFNSSTGSHFFTSSTSEYNKVRNTLPQYQDEGIKFYVFSKNAGPNVDRRPVYRFYKPSKGTHFLTGSESEKNKLINNFETFGLSYEQVIYYEPL